MMKQSWTALALLLLACQAAPEQAATADAAPAQETPEPVKAVLFEGTALGKPLTLEYLTPVSDILARPDEFMGRRVLVEGVVAAVCQKQGCWMDVLGGEGGDTIQIKVDDGVIVFPKDAAGKRVLAEGTVEKLELTAEQALEAGKHKAEESGTTFDPASVTGPVTSYRIRGLGVRISA
jgi:hypothetical protein